MNKCQKCDLELSDVNWYWFHKLQNYKYCKKCWNKRRVEYKNTHPKDHEHQKEFMRKYAKKHRKELTAQRRIYRDRIRKEVLIHYGKNAIIACVKCGFSDIRALSLDHINGRGAEERKAMKQVGYLKNKGFSLYMWLRKAKYPLGYQTLCMNCQYIKRWENKEYN